MSISWVMGSLTFIDFYWFFIKLTLNCNKMLEEFYIVILGIEDFYIVILEEIVLRKLGKVG